MVKVDVLVGSQRATTGSFGWIGRREAALFTQEKRPGTLDPAERPWPSFQWPPKSPFTPRLAIQAGRAHSMCCTDEGRLFVWGAARYDIVIKAAS